MQAGSRRRVVRDRLHAPAPEKSKEQDAEEAEEEWELYQKEATSRLNQHAAVSSHGDILAESSVHPSCMSGAEADTFVDSLSIAPPLRVTPHGQITDKCDLAEAFDFGKKCESTWRLPIHESKQNILDRVKGSQVVVLTGPTGCGKSTQVMN